MYRYRKLGSINAQGRWIESGHWKDDIDGICMFSKPDRFCDINDSGDCKVYFDEKSLNDYICAGMNREQRREQLKDTRNQLIKYCKHLQSCLRIGCFTTAAPTEREMWEDKDFGDMGHAICFEYNVNKWDFAPSTIPFLPVLYDDDPYDSTEVMKALVDAERYPDGTIGHSRAESRLVCMGFGHALIKKRKYHNEKEWRVIIPETRDDTYKHYYNVGHGSKRDMKSAVSAVYLGYAFDETGQVQKYKDALLGKWSSRGVKIYQMVDEDGMLVPREISS